MVSFALDLFCARDNFFFTPAGGIGKGESRND